MYYTIEEIKQKTIPIAMSYGIKSMSLFGSYARGEASDESDVDIYIERGNIRSLIQYFAFVQELENILECHVDVVTRGMADVNFLHEIEKEGVLLYEG